MPNMAYNYAYFITGQSVSGKDDSLEIPFVISLIFMIINPTVKNIFPGYVKLTNIWMDEYLVLKTLILASFFHIEHNKTPQISRDILINANNYMITVVFSWSFYSSLFLGAIYRILYVHLLDPPQLWVLFHEFCLSLSSIQGLQC